MPAPGGERTVGAPQEGSGRGRQMASEPSGLPHLRTGDHARLVLVNRLEEVVCRRVDGPSLGAKMIDLAADFGGVERVALHIARRGGPDVAGRVGRL